jgi:hypothetical protein
MRKHKMGICNICKSCKSFNLGVYDADEGRMLSQDVGGTGPEDIITEWQNRKLVYLILINLLYNLVDVDKINLFMTEFHLNNV